MQSLIWSQPKQKNVVSLFLPVHRIGPQPVWLHAWPEKWRALNSKANRNQHYCCQFWRVDLTYGRCTSVSHTQLSSKLRHSSLDDKKNSATFLSVKNVPENMQTKNNWKRKCRERTAQATGFSLFRPFWNIVIREC